VRAQAVILPCDNGSESHRSCCVRQLIAWQSSRSIIGNLALHSAEEPDDLRATTDTVEVHTIRDNDAALALGARPIQQHEPAARHNGAQRVATANIDGAPVYALHMAQSPDQHEEHFPRYDGSPSTFVSETPEGAAHVTRQLFGTVEESPDMTPSSLDSAYASRPMELDAAQWTTPAFSEYQTPSRKARADTRIAEERQTSITVTRSSPKERHRGRTRRETECDDDGYGKEATAPRRKAQSTPSTRKNRGSSRSTGSTPKRARERLQLNDVADSSTEEKGSSA